ISSQVRHARISRAAEYFRLPASAAVHLSRDRPALPWLGAPLGSSAIPRRAPAAAFRHGYHGSGALRPVLPRFLAYRHADLRVGVRAGEKRGLDAARAGAPAALLLPPVDVRGAVPLGERSGQRPARGLAR